MSANHDLGASIDCRCDTQKVHAVQAHLHARLPVYVLRDSHSPTDHHVVSLTHELALPCHAVLLNEFWEHSVEEIEACLQQWRVATMLRAYRIIVVSKNGVSPVADQT